MSRSTDAKALNQERFSRFADDYVRSQDLAGGGDLDRLLDLARPLPHWAVLDVATGGGHTAIKFSPLVGHIVAIDLSYVMLAKAKNHGSSRGAGNISYHQADAEALPFPADYFHLVTCRIAPHHFPDVSRFVREAARVLLPDGKLLIQDLILPNEPATAEMVNGFEKLRDPAHHQAFTQVAWEAMYTAAKLQVIHSEHYIKRHQFQIWIERQKCSPQVVARLQAIMEQAPKGVRDWLQPLNINTPQATFVNRHLIILGQK